VSSGIRDVLAVNDNRLDVSVDPLDISSSSYCGPASATASRQPWTPHAVVAYDFVSYLARIDPSQSYVVTQLTRGIVNFTVRASKNASQHPPGGRFPEDDSLILKQTPSYVADVGTFSGLGGYLPMAVSSPEFGHNACDDFREPPFGHPTLRQWAG
jgi:hypothetical protein